MKRTADIKESAAYLALLTRGLQRLYQVSRCTCQPVPPGGSPDLVLGKDQASLGALFSQGHTLHSRPLGSPGDLHPETRTAPNPLCSLLTFSDFNAGAIKNKVLPPPSPNGLSCQALAFPHPGPPVPRPSLCAKSLSGS